MKTISRLFLLAVLLINYCRINAQSSLNYSVQNTTTGSLAADNLGNTINTGSATNLLFNWSSNNTSSLQPIGFEFIFMGKYYTHFIVGSNGQVALGNYNSSFNIISGSAANDLTRAVSYPSGTDSAAILAAFWDVMTTPNTGATVRSVLTGTFPNRCRVIEWNEIINFNGSGPTPSGVFQMRLYENSGVIEYVYGSMAIVSSSTTVTASIGFTAGKNDNQFLALQDLSSFNFTAVSAQEPATQNLVNSAAVGPIAGLNSAANGSRRVFTFTPPALSGTPLSGLQVLETGASNVSLKWNDTYSNELGYTILTSTDGVNFTAAATVAANTSNYMVGNLTQGTTYYFKVLAITEGASYPSAVVSAITNCYFNGTYTIGPGGNYASLSKAADSLRIKGVAGNVVFELLSGYNSSAEVFPISFPKTAQIPCLGTKTVTVRPQAGATNIVINGSSNNPLVLLDSVHYLSIDGRPGGNGTQSQLSIINNNAAPAIRFSNAGNNKLLYVKLGGGISGSSIYEGVVNLQGSKAAGSDNNKLAYCDVFSAATAPAAKSILLYSTAASGFVNDNDSIVNCNFYNYGSSAIDLTDFNDGWLLQGNSFYNTTGISYSNAVATIKLEASSNAVLHQIIQNHFGGTAPNGQGTAMNIGYNQSYYCMDIAARASVSSNYFTRMRFTNASNTNGAQIRMININNAPETYSINNNQFGSADPADSLHFFQAYSDYNMAVAGIYTNSYSTINNNQFKNIHCYAPAGNISLQSIMAQGGSNIHYNRIGNPVTANDIMNNSNGATFGIMVNGPGVNMTNNTVCRISANGDQNSASLTGIYFNGGSVDSVYNNTVFQLKNGNGATSNGQSITGILIYSSSPGGQANLVEANNVYSIVNDCNSGGGNVTGIQVGNNLYVRKNFIRNLYSTNTSNISYVYGILIPNKYSELENNMVSLGLDSNGNSITAGNIYFAGVSGGHVMKHNSIYIGGSNVTDGFMGSACYLFLGNALPSGNINNIYFNARSNANAGSSAKHQAVNIDLSYTSDYNIYHYTGTGGIMGTFTAVRYNDLAAWKTATGVDLNSLDADPRFLLPAAASNNVNLHLQYGSPAESAGWDQYTTFFDFDNDVRFLLGPVDIGADAGNLLNCPVANAGYDRTIVLGDSVQIGGYVNNNASYSWTGPGGFTSTLQKPFVSPAADAVYLLTITSGVCTSSDTVKVFVVAAPVKILCPGGSTTINADNQGSSYNWQVNSGNGFTDINNNAVYSGAYSPTLQLTNIPSSYYGYQYRCMTDTTVAGVITTLKFENNWTGAISNLWNNPGNWSCGVLPDGNTDIFINSGTVLVNVNAIVRTLHAAPGATVTVSPGVTLTILH